MARGGSRGGVARRQVRRGIESAGSMQIGVPALSIELIPHGQAGVCAEGLRFRLRARTRTAQDIALHHVRANMIPVVTRKAMTFWRRRSIVVDCGASTRAWLLQRPRRGSGPRIQCLWPLPRRLRQWRISQGTSRRSFCMVSQGSWKTVIVVAVDRVGESCLKVRLLVDAELRRELLRGPIQRGRTSMAEIGLSAEGAGTALSRSLGQKRGAGAERSIRTS